MKKPSLQPPWSPYKIRRARGDVGEWGVVAEVAVEIGFNGEPAAVMMASPNDLEDFAVGFALTEDILKTASAVENINVGVFPEGVTVDIRAPKEEIQASSIRRRMLEGRSGCGLCGVETLAEAMRSPRRRVKTAELQDSAVLRAFSEMARAQPLNAATRSAHAAAFASFDGDIQCLREDVGRHNALDKLIGACMRNGLDGAQGFVVMSSRCSYELVQKTAILGAPVLATISGPTTAALNLAALVGLELYCLDKDELVRFEKAT